MSTGAVSGRDETRSDLAERCKEVLDWHRTGLLPGDKLRALADTLNEHIPDHQRLHIEEDKTAAEAMHYVIEHTSTPAQSVDLTQDEIKSLEGLAYAMGFGRTHDALRKVIHHLRSPAECQNDDTMLIDTLRAESWDLRCFDMPTGGGDADIGWRVVGHWQAEPHERTVGEAFEDDPRAAIRDAIARTSSR